MTAHAQVPDGKTSESPSTRPGRGRLEKTIEQLAAEQGVTPMSDWNDYFGAARHLWESDEDFEAFLEAARRPCDERA